MQILRGMFRAHEITGRVTFHSVPGVSGMKINIYIYIKNLNVFCLDDFSILRALSAGGNRQIYIHEDPHRKS